MNELFRQIVILKVGVFLFLYFRKTAVPDKIDLRGGKKFVNLETKIEN